MVTLLANTSSKDCKIPHEHNLKCICTCRSPWVQKGSLLQNKLSCQKKWWMETHLRNSLYQSLSLHEDETFLLPSLPVTAKCFGTYHYTVRALPEDLKQPGIWWPSAETDTLFPHASGQVSSLTLTVVLGWKTEKVEIWTCSLHLLSP